MSQINVNTIPFGNGSDFNPQNTTARSQGSITLKSDSGSTIRVYTYQQNGSAWVKAHVFAEGQSPYNASTGNGNNLTLRSGIIDEILLSLSPNPPALSDGPLTGSNGMINVNTGDPE